MADKGYNYTKPRGPIGAMYSSPGPIYMLPTLIGEKDHDARSTFIKAPAYSLAKPLKDIYSDRSPGPAAYAQNAKYTNYGEDASPKYTITGIPKDYYKGGMPGPADYNVDAGSKLVHMGAPSHFMGQRLKFGKTSDTPAPNAYSLPEPSKRSEIPSAPQYTIGGRTDTNVHGLNKQPGPADYTLGSPEIVQTSGPKYTMGLALPKKEQSSLPGPLSYKAELVDAHLTSTPKFTMGIKHSQYKGDFVIKHEDDC